MTADICVAANKYSYATGVRPDNVIPWTHIVASDVFVILKGEDTHIRDGQLYLRVVQGNSVLVRADLMFHHCISSLTFFFRRLYTSANSWTHHCKCGEIRKIPVACRWNSSPFSAFVKTFF